MKKIYLKTFIATLLLLYCATTNAHDFEVGGIYYNITDATAKTTEVTYKGGYSNEYSNEYSGEVVIPAIAAERYRTTVQWSNIGSIVAIEESEGNKNLVDLGACGDNLTCAIDTVENKLFINGTGEMYDYFYTTSPSPWNSYRNRITSVSFDNGITSIGSWAFYYCLNLVDVIIPNSITSIRNGAFFGCHSLSSIKIPNSVTNIATEAFGCHGLTSIIIESGNAVYDSRDNCNAIIETATNKLIQGCKSTVIPNSVTSIGYMAFYGCRGPRSIKIPDSVTFIDEWAFHNCIDLTSVTIGNGVTTIARNAFSGFNGLESTKVESGNAVYDSRDNCNAIIETATNKLIQGCKSTVIPNSVTSIGYMAFNGCTGLKSVTIPNSVTSIGDYAFYSCTGLTSVTIPNSVTSIGYMAFNGCTGLKSITIPNSVIKIEYKAFSCKYLTNVFCLATTIPETSSDALDFDIANATLHVPAVAVESYRTTAPWSNFGTIVAIEKNEENKYFVDLGSCGDSITCTIDIAENKLFINGTGEMYDFDYKNNAPWYNYREYISSVSINDGVTTIGNDAFRGCSGLTSVTIPNSVTSIGDYAFYSCTGLTSVTIPNSVTSIGNSAFEHCGNLTSIEIPNSVTTIGHLAFNVCLNLSSIKVDSGNTVYDSRDNCNAIIETATNTLIKGAKNAKIPNGVVKIGNSAFNWLKGLTNIEIPNSVTIIDEWAFDMCTDLKSITIGNNVTTIGYRAFGGCTSLSNVYCLAMTIPEASSGALDFDIANATLHVPAAAVESYRTTAPWSNFGTIVAIEGSEDEPTTIIGEAIDLGLSVKWASCNVGATSPVEYGSYYAWGETEKKSFYDWETYKWSNGTKNSITKYCNNSEYGTVDNKTTLDPEDDVAHVKWGDNWRMPTLTELQELIDSCTWVWTTLNEVKGYEITGPNGNSIFLPASGFRSKETTKAKGSEAHYWARSLNNNNSNAFTIYFYNKGHRCSFNYRGRGHTVRPVYDDGNSTSIEIITPEVNKENTIYDLCGQRLTEITAPGIYIVNGKKVIVK